MTYGNADTRITIDITPRSVRRAHEWGYLWIRLHGIFGPRPQYSQLASAMVVAKRLCGRRRIAWTELPPPFGRGWKHAINWANRGIRIGAIQRRLLELRAAYGVPISIWADDFAARAMLDIKMEYDLLVLNTPIISCDEADRSGMLDRPGLLLETHLPHMVDFPFWGMHFEEHQRLGYGQHKVHWPSDEPGAASTPRIGGWVYRAVRERQTMRSIITRRARMRPLPETSPSHTTQ